MLRGRQPECENCRVPLTIIHILIDWQATQAMRIQLKLLIRIQNLLGVDCSVATLIVYLVKSNLLDEI